MNKIFFTLALILLSSSFAHANKITWLGQAAVLIKTKQGKRILIDPFIFDNPKTPKAFKDEKKYKDIDLILVTHGHGDHLGDFEKIVLHFIDVCQDTIGTGNSARKCLVLPLVYYKGWRAFIHFLKPFT